MPLSWLQGWSRPGRLSPDLWWILRHPPLGLTSRETRGVPVTSDEGDPWKLSSRRKPNSYPATPVQCLPAGGVFTEERPRPTAAEIAAVSRSFLLRTQAASTSNAKRENEGEARTDLCPQGQLQSKPQPASISTRDAARRGDGAGRGKGADSQLRALRASRPPRLFWAPFLRETVTTARMPEPLSSTS